LCSKQVKKQQKGLIFIEIYVLIADKRFPVISFF